jgi:hypothetical protein
VTGKVGPRNLAYRLGVSVDVEGPRFKLLDDEGFRIRGTLADLEWSDFAELLEVLGEVFGEMLLGLL